MSVLNTLGDIKNQFLIRSQGDTSIAFYTDTILNDWADEAHRMAASFKKWPFTEGRVTTTYSSSTEEWDYPEGWKPNSIRLLQIGGYRVQKLNFNDYQMFREENPTDDDRVYSDFGGRYFINPNIDVGGTITAWGQYTPAGLGADPTAKTVFSDRDEDGNEAIVEIIFSFAALREKDFKSSDGHLKKAFALLDNVWKRIKDEKFGYQTKNRSMFDRIDVLQGETTDELFNRDQF